VKKAGSILHVIVVLGAYPLLTTASSVARIVRIGQRELHKKEMKINDLLLQRDDSRAFIRLPRR
jgi:hypothetical protein